MGTPDACQRTPMRRLIPDAMQLHASTARAGDHLEGRNQCPRRPQDVPRRRWCMKGAAHPHQPSDKRRRVHDNRRSCRASDRRAASFVASSAGAGTPDIARPRRLRTTSRPAARPRCLRSAGLHHRQRLDLHRAVLRRRDECRVCDRGIEVYTVADVVAAELFLDLSERAAGRSCAGHEPHCGRRARRL
jgi:hypothetical protein